jgi:hypothetical protein
MSRAVPTAPHGINARAWRIGYLDWVEDRAETCRPAFPGGSDRAAYLAGYTYAMEGGA